MTEENVFLKQATRSWRILGIHILISTAILLGAVAVTIFIGFGKSPRSGLELPTLIPTVETEVARRETSGVTFQVDGVVIPFRKVVVAFEVSGNITFLAENCRIGRYVQKGDVLARVDQRDYQYALEEARQSLIKAEREIEEWKIAVVNNQESLKIAQEQFRTQNQETERCRKLYQKGAVSQTEMETAMLNLLSRKETVVTLTNESNTLEGQKERLEASRELARVEVKKAELDLERCTIHAPITGLVVGLDAEQDKFVQRGESLATIHDTSRLEVQCSLYMKQVEWLWSEDRQEMEAQNTGAKPIFTQESSAMQELATAQNVGVAQNAGVAQNVELAQDVGMDSEQKKGEKKIFRPEGAGETSRLEELRRFYQFDDTPVVLRYELNGAVYQWRGTLTYLDGPGLDSRTRMMPCRVVVENPLQVEAFTEDGQQLQNSVSPTLMPGMFVTVEIHANPAYQMLNLSEMALLPGGTVWKVVKNDENKDVLARASKIMTAHFNTKTGRVIVYAKQGVLEPGDRVIVSPLASPVEGAYVNVKKTETDENRETKEALRTMNNSENREVLGAGETLENGETAEKSTTFGDGEILETVKIAEAEKGMEAEEAEEIEEPEEATEADSFVGKENERGRGGKEETP